MINPYECPQCDERVTYECRRWVDYVLFLFHGLGHCGGWWTLWLARQDSWAYSNAGVVLFLFSMGVLMITVLGFTHTYYFPCLTTRTR